MNLGTLTALAAQTSALQTPIASVPPCPSSRPLMAYVSHTVLSSVAADRTHAWGMLLPAIPVTPVGIWGTLSSSDPDPAGQDGPHVTGGPVGHLGTLSPSTTESGILVGCSPHPTLLG